MIDPSIYKVYKEEKKVIIPDFGAIIYSEATDSNDFNDLLTFDDGKVIEEIQSRQKSGKREARKALKDHLEKIKNKLEEGKPHLIRGLGYLYKDEQGSYAIQKKKPEIKSTEKKVSKEDQEVAPVIPPLDNESDELNTTDQLEVEDTATPALNDEIEEITEQPLSEDLPADEIASDDFSQQENEQGDEERYEEDENNSLGDEEDNYGYSSLLIEEDEDVQDYYKRKNEYYEGDTRQSRKWYYVAAVIALLALIAFGLYYFVLDSDQDMNSTDQTPLASAEGEESLTEQSENPSISEASNQSTEYKDEEMVSETVTEEQNNLLNEEDQAISAFDNSNNHFNNRTYSLILGSFKVEDNAHNFRKYLMDKQREVSIFNWGGSFHFVGFERIEGKDEALKLLTVMREEEEPSSWIIRNREN